MMLEDRASRAYLEAYQIEEAQRQKEEKYQQYLRRRRRRMKRILDESSKRRHEEMRQRARSRMVGGARGGVDGGGAGGGRSGGDGSGGETSDRSAQIDEQGNVSNLDQLSDSGAGDNDGAGLGEDRDASSTASDGGEEMDDAWHPAREGKDEEDGEAGGDSAVAGVGESKDHPSHGASARGGSDGGTAAGAPDSAMHDLDVLPAGDSDAAASGGHGRDDVESKLEAPGDLAGEVPQSSDTVA